jgi:hypothetical protein
VKAYALLAAALLASACSKTKSFRLPSDPQGDLAFAVLYDAGDSIAAIGPVVRRQTLTQGHYTIDNKDGSLRPRLFFVALDKLKAAANAACATLQTRIEQITCAEEVKTCDTDPIACLSVLSAGTSCADRLTLMGLPMNAYASTDSGSFEAIADPTALIAHLTLCGPVVKPTCPIRIPGFIVSEAGAFRCVAPSNQVACELSVDLGACGLGTASGTLSNDGSFGGSIDTSGCALAPLSAGDVPSGTPGFSIACGGRRFVAQYMDVLFGTAGCARRAPSIFDSARAVFAGSRSGVITGLKAVTPSGWKTRYLVLGSGQDDCAIDGCSFQNMDCATYCNADCYMTPVLAACANAFDYAACVPGSNAVDDCYMRCVAACSAPASASVACSDDFSGHHLAVTATTAPESFLGVVDFGTALRSPLPATGHSALALVGDPSAPLILAATKSAVRAYVPRIRDGAVDPVTASATIAPAIASGVVAVAGRSDAAIVYGRTTGAEPKGFIARLSITAKSPSVSRTATIADLPSIDAADVGGPGNGWVFAISTTPPLGSAPSDQLDLWPIDPGPSTGPISLPGHPTALAALPGGAVAIGVSKADGSAEIDVVTPSGGGFSAPIAFGTFKRLRVSAMTIDPSCASGPTCRVYVGYEQAGDTAEAGNALVGIFDYNSTSPAMSRLVPSFVVTAAPELSLLEYDAATSEIVAVASALNRITKIAVVR